LFFGRRLRDRLERGFGRFEKEKTDGDQSERETNDFHSAEDDDVQFFKWPTPQRKPRNNNNNNNNNNNKALYPWWRSKSQRWTGPCTRPASCPFYSALRLVVPFDEIDRVNRMRLNWSPFTTVESFKRANFGREIVQF